MTRLLQYYDVEKLVRVFSSRVNENTALADITSESIVDISSAKVLLKKIGFKFNKVDKTEYGFSVEVEI